MLEFNDRETEICVNKRNKLSFYFLLLSMILVREISSIYKLFNLWFSCHILDVIVKSSNESTTVIIPNCLSCLLQVPIGCDGVGIS